MKLWTLAVIVERCGKCGGDIRVGQPYLRMVLVNVRRYKLRCRECADDACPSVVLPPDAFKPLAVMRQLGYLPLDEREPGSEG